MSTPVWLLFLWNCCIGEVIIWQRVVVTGRVRRRRRPSELDLPEYDRLIHSEPARYLISVSFKDDLSIIDEIINDLTSKPTAVSVLKVQWQIPMIKRD